MGKIITFSNQKGGSGKTTLTANLAVLWSNSKYRVAVIDGDAQKSLTYWLEARKKYYGENDIGIVHHPPLCQSVQVRGIYERRTGSTEVVVSVLIVENEEDVRSVHDTTFAEAG